MTFQAIFFNLSRYLKLEALFSNYKVNIIQQVQATPFHPSTILTEEARALSNRPPAEKKANEPHAEPWDYSAGVGPILRDLNCLLFAPS